MGTYRSQIGNWMEQQRFSIFMQHSTTVNNIISMAFQSKDSDFYVRYVIFHFLFSDLCHVSIVHQDPERVFNGQTGPPHEFLCVDM